MGNLAEVKKAPVKITLNDGKEREVRFTLNALAELEEIFGSVQVAFDKLEKENSMKALRAILWAGFIHAEPNLTEKQVGNLIDLAYMQELMSSLNQAFENDMARADNTIVGDAAPNA